jgi:hypothetical protein
MKAALGRVPPWGGLAGGLIALGWWAMWHPAAVGRGNVVGFFLLWLGYCLAVDALVAVVAAPSMLQRRPGRWLGLFGLSVPGWWLFEVLNRFLRNWQYLGAEAYSSVEYAVLASLSFSTVTPAVLETAELVALALAARPAQREAHPASPRGRPSPIPSAAIAADVSPSRAVLAGTVGGGLALLLLIVVAPEIWYPAAWIAPVLILDAVNALAGWPAVLPALRRGVWRPAASVALAALVCGFFWEFWNSAATPRWVYHVPIFLDQRGWEAPRLFEMPLPGYLGYLPFGAAVYAFAVYGAGLAGLAQPGFARIFPLEEVP